MKTFALLLFASLCAAGCADRAVNQPRTAREDGAPTTVRTADQTLDRDNTGVNVRDRNDATKTPIDQNENKRDVQLTADIRKHVVDKDMSVNARNVKIITQDGRVTLRGPVKDEAEKNAIAVIAVEVAGAGNVDNQLEVEAKP